MATKKIANLPGSIDADLLAFVNDDVASRRRAGICLHEDFPAAADLITSPDASSLATSVALANEMKAKWNSHVASTAKHRAADATNVVTSPDATNLATTQTLLNEIKTDFNAHQDSATFHHLGGAGGFAVPADVATADASDQATANALANALKAAINRHISSGAPTVELVAS